MEKRSEILELKLRESASDSRISCALARKIAEDLNITYKEVGETADRLHIKIKNCELGCF